MNHRPTSEPPAVRQSQRLTFRALLWEYLGHPADETPERRRILYAIVILRLGLGLMFLLRGWSAVFAAPPDAFATRLGDPARFGLSGLAADTTLFILGCTELGIGVLLIAGAFTRVSAVTGGVLAILYLIFGNHQIRGFCDWTEHPTGAMQFFCQGDVSRGGLGEWLVVRVSELIWLTSINPALLTIIGGLALLTFNGSPFLSADRALDKVEEEERDRAPALLPGQSTASPLFMRIGIAAGIVWYVLQGVAIDLPLSIIAGLLLLGIGTRILALGALIGGLLCLVPIYSFADSHFAIANAIGALSIALALTITGAGAICVPDPIQRILGVDQTSSTNGLS
jgi:uncharacterized membrane protein YphA (DoxX/SURF4 family)